jgi:hypothetical protein
MSDASAEILFPDRTVETRSGPVTVREFRFLESLRATLVSRPLIESLAALFRSAEGGHVPLIDVLAVFAAHPDIVLDLLELATGRSRDEIAIQSIADGHALLMALWEANQDFFTEQLLLLSERTKPST